MHLVNDNKMYMSLRVYKNYRLVVIEIMTKEMGIQYKAIKSNITYDIFMNHTVSIFGICLDLSDSLIEVTK